MKIICIGSSVYDVTIPTDEYPKENNKSKVGKYVECGGGTGSNAAYLLGKWGMDVYFAGSVGKDATGLKIKKELESVGVKTKYLKLDKKINTRVNYIIANKGNGSRTILSYNEPQLQLDNLKLSFKPDIILVDGKEIEAAKQVITKYKDAISVIDAERVNDDVVEIAKMVDYLVCSKDFAEEFSGIKIDYNDTSTLSKVYSILKKTFNNNIVVTLEAKGSLYETDGKLKIMPSIKVTPLDSTGAGDIFHGSFVYGLAKKFPIEKILKISNAAGALSVTRLGGRNSVLSREEMSEQVDEFE